MKKIEIKNLNKSYYIGNDEFKVLKDLEVSFDQGEFVAVYGESGSGKSTFMNVVGGLDIFESGDILIEGDNIDKFTSNSMDFYRNRKVGFIFQEFNLLENLTLLDNVMLPMDIAGVSTSDAKSRATELLIKVGLEAHIKKKVSQLSGGQKQRVAIARALANDPDIILADEPTGALDSKTTVEILTLLQDIASEGKLVVAITHSAVVSEYASRVVTLIDGVIVENVGETKVVTEHKYELETKKNNSNLSLRKAFKIARANLFSRKVRTFLVAFGVSLGITGSIIITSLSQNAIDDVNSGFASFEQDLTNVSVGATTSDGKDVSIDESVTAIEMYSSDFEGYEGTFPDYVINTNDTLNLEEDGTQAPVENTGEVPVDPNLVSEESINTYQPMVQVDHSAEEFVTISFGEYPQAQNEVYFSGSITEIEAFSEMLDLDPEIDYSDFLKVDPNKKNEEYYKYADIIENDIIGKTFEIKDIHGDTTEFKIVGSKEVTLFSFSNAAFILPGEYSEDVISKYKEDRNMVFAFLYTVKFDSEDNAASYLSTIDANIATGAESGYNDVYISSRDIRSLTQFVNSLVSVVRNVLLVLVGVSLVVSVFMVSVIVYISTIERKVEIGTLRAIGAKKINITTIFVNEGILLGILAFILATIGSIIMVTGVNAILYFGVSGGIGDFNQIRLSIPWLFIIGALIIVIMFLASLIPAIGASRQNPIDALREE